jgi:hypothetical protein
MREAWEREAAFYQHQRRSQGGSPWGESRKWRRRFWFSVVVNVALVLLLIATRGQ